MADWSGSRSETVTSLAELILRTADCLTSLLQSPTARAGLNEARYKVLESLRHRAPEHCSQTDLAQNLLQSESNLSTLLERMRKDGLIVRLRSAHDRRVTLVALTPEGRDALDRAEAARARTAARVLPAFDRQQAAALRDELRLLQDRLERTLGVSGRGRTRIDTSHRGPAGEAGDRLQWPSATVAVRSPDPLTATEKLTP